MKIEWEEKDGYLGKEYLFKDFRISSVTLSYYNLYRNYNYIGTFGKLKSAKKVVELIVKG